MTGAREPLGVTPAGDFVFPGPVPVNGAAMDRLRHLEYTNMRRRIEIAGRVTVPLRTGQLGAGSRAEHARALAVARLKRRRQRRHGIPAATQRRIIILPKATVSMPNLDGFWTAVAATADAFASFSRAVVKATGESMANFKTHLPKEELK